MQIGRLQVGVVGALEIAEPEAQHLAATEEQLGALGRLAHQARQPPERLGRLGPRLLLEVDARQQLERARLHRQLRQHQLEVVARRLAIAELAAPARRGGGAAR